MEQQTFKDAEQFNYGQCIKTYLTGTIVLPDLQCMSNAYNNLLNHKGLERTALIVESGHVRQAIAGFIPYPKWSGEGLRIATLKEYLEDQMTYKDMTIIFEHTLVYKFLDYFDTLASMAHEQRDKLKERIGVLEGLNRQHEKNAYTAQARVEVLQELQKQLKSVESAKKELYDTYQLQCVKMNKYEKEFKRITKLMKHPIMKLAQQALNVSGRVEETLKDLKSELFLTKIRLRNMWRGW